MTSPEQRALTEAHRQAQLALAARSMMKSKVAYQRFLDVSNLDASFPAWSLIMGEIVNDGFNGSVILAERYVQRTAKLHGVDLAEIGLTPQASAEKLNSALLVNGPINIKQKIGAGLSPGAAKRAAQERFLGVIKEQVLAGGRELIPNVSRYLGRSGRWRRVTDGEPCAFCAMLAGRGPVYSSETVTFESHRGCGCAAELVLGDWEPTQKEKLWRASYDLAASDADMAGVSRVAPVVKNEKFEDNILWRMRRNSPELFSDGVFPKR